MIKYIFLVTSLLVGHIVKAELRVESDSLLLNTPDRSISVTIRRIEPDVYSVFRSKRINYTDTSFTLNLTRFTLSNPLIIVNGSEKSFDQLVSILSKHKIKRMEVLNSYEGSMKYKKKGSNGMIRIKIR